MSEKPFGLDLRAPPDRHSGSQHQVASLREYYEPSASVGWIAGPAAERPEYIRELAELATSGALRPVVDRRYDFLQIAGAHAYVATRRKRGSVVVSVAPV